MKKTLCYAMMLALLVTSIPLSIAEDLSIQNVVFQDESLPYGSVEAPDDEDLEFEGNGAADDMSSLSIDGDVELPGTIQTVEGIPDLTVEISGGLLEGEMPNETEDGTNEDASMEPPLVENEPDEGDLRFDYYYYKIEDGKAIITDVEKQKIYDDDGRFVEENKLQYVNVNIPEAIDGCPVTRIGGGVFDGAKNLQSVTLPDSLREIGWGAFANCESLSDVALPAGLELLDCFAFNNCHSLTKINIPINVHSHEYVTEHAYSGPFVNCENLREVVFAEGMATVPKGLFFRCPGIRDITVPNTVNKIEIGAFEECAGLASVTIPESVKEIDNYAFAWSESLKSAKLPSGLTYLGIGAFKGCKALSKINIPAKVKMHGYCAENYMYPGPFAECSGLRTVTFDNGISVIPHGMFYKCDGIQKIKIPNTVEAIEGSAFKECPGLVTVTIPKSVKQIYDYAFAWSESLESAKLPSGLTYLGIGAFKGCKALSKINIPAKVKMHGYCAENYMYPGPFAECSGLRTVTFNKGISVIPRGLFYQCDGLREITIPDSVTEIQYEAFYNCVNLRKIKLGKKLKFIGDNAFIWCESLKSATLPASLTYLGLAAFKGCKALAKINIPAKMNTNDRCGDNRNFPGPFSECSGLRTVTFAKGIKSIPKGLFYQCDGIRKITIPDSVVKIRDSAFCVCNSLTQVKIGKKVQVIENYALSYNPKLTSVNLPGSLKSIGDYAFGWCEKLGKVVLPAKLTYIGAGAYMGCVKLSKINIPAKLKTNSWCGENTDYPGPFAECKNLKTVTFAKGIKVIPKGLFYQCNGIEKITLPDSIVTLEAEAFCCCSALTEIHIGKNVKTIGEYAFYGCDALKTVDYALSKGDWKKITIEDNNEPLLEARLHVQKGIYILCLGAAEGTDDDVDKIYSVLRKNKIDGYTIKRLSKKSLTKSGSDMIAELKADTSHKLDMKKYLTKEFYDYYIKESFMGATKDDLCFMYLHGHGEGGGPVGKQGRGLAVLNKDGEERAYTYEDFLETLTKYIPGQIIFLPDVCFSGGFVDIAKRYPISGKDRLNIISSSTRDQSSSDVYPDNIILLGKVWFEGKIGIGNYTASLSDALYLPKLKADTSKKKDGVSVQELFDYIKKTINKHGHNYGQTVQCYSQNRDRIIFQ